MLIVNCIGGLGNQMFQYAYYTELRLQYTDVYFDVSGFSNYKLHNGYELGRVFGISPNIIDPEIVAIYKKKSAGLLSKFRCQKFVVLQKDFGFNNRYLRLKNSCFLDGYWQSEQYFANCTKKLYHDFAFPQLDKLNLSIAKSILDLNSISIHIRRGDYVNHPMHGEICTLDYYMQAIDIIKAKVQNPVFYVFSNDIDWCKNNLYLDNATYVCGNDGYNSYKDMHLMSLCKHNIIANSSFSWWGAWLNKNSSKVVIAPKKWFNDKKINIKDLIPDSWIKI